MADQNHKRPSLRDQDAADIRNAQRAGVPPVAEGGEGGPEASDVMRRVWSEPGGEAYNYRNAMLGAGGEADDHSELTAAETPETHRHLSDASLSGGGTPEQDAGEAADTLGQPDPGKRKA